MLIFLQGYANFIDLSQYMPNFCICLDLNALENTVYVFCFLVLPRGMRMEFLVNS